MEDHRTLENMLKLLNKLATRAYTPEEIAEILEVSPRTAYRYLTTLTDVGYVLRKDDNKAYRLSKSDAMYTDLSQLVHFTKEEEALVYDIMQRLSSDAVIQRKLKAKMASVFNLDAVAKSVTESKLHSDLDNLLYAVKNKCCVRLVDYKSGNSGTISDREVEPYEFTDNYSTVWALDLKDGKNKQFKMERASRVEVLKNRPWTHQSKHQSDPVDVFRSCGRETYSICFDMDLLAHNLLIEEYPSAKQYVSKQGDDCWRLVTEVRNIKTVARFVMGLIDHIEIHGSPELRTEIAERLRIASSKVR